MIKTVLLQLLSEAKFNMEILVFFCDILLLHAVVRGLGPANGILLLHWTLQHLRMQWSRFILIMLVIW